MPAFPIPVVAVLGPGSQPDDEEKLNYMSMPDDMGIYHPPPLPESASLKAAPQADAVLQKVLTLLQQAAQGGAGGAIAIATLPDADRQLVNQLLGEGEVSAVIETSAVSGAEDAHQAGGDERVQIQESVFAGVWRVLRWSSGRLEADQIEVGSAPQLLRQAAGDWLWPYPPQWTDSLPPNVVNAPALVQEVRDQACRWRSGQSPYVVNLSLLPVSPEDIGYLDYHLGTGSVRVLSRGYGRCRILSTRTPHCWRVIYYNGMDNVILNTVEVTDMPDSVRAAPEDMQAAHARLADILHMLREETGHAHI